MDLSFKRRWKKKPKNPWPKLISRGKGGGVETCNAHIQKGKRELTEWEERKRAFVFHAHTTQVEREEPNLLVKLVMQSIFGLKPQFLCVYNDDIFS